MYTQVASTSWTSQDNPVLWTWWTYGGGIRYQGISVRPLQLDNSTNKTLACVGITHEHIAASEHQVLQNPINANHLSSVQNLGHSMKYWLLNRHSPFLDYYNPQYMKGSLIPELIINQPSFTVSVISTYIPIYPYNSLYIFDDILFFIIIINPARGLAATAHLPFQIAIS